MVEIIDGKLTGTVEVPVSDLAAASVIHYSGHTFDGMTAQEIADLLGATKRSVEIAIYNARYNHRETCIIRRSRPGRPKGTKTAKIAIRDDDPVPVARIKTYMICRKESVSDIARITGTSYKSAYNWIGNRPSIPSPKYLTKLANHWGTTSAYLAGETNNPYRRF